MQHLWVPVGVCTPESCRWLWHRHCAPWLLSPTNPDIPLGWEPIRLLLLLQDSPIHSFLLHPIPLHPSFPNPPDPIRTHLTPSHFQAAGAPQGRPVPPALLQPTAPSLLPAQHTAADTQLQTHSCRHTHSSQLQAPFPAAVAKCSRRVCRWQSHRVELLWPRSAPGQRAENRPPRGSLPSCSLCTLGVAPRSLSPSPGLLRPEPGSHHAHSAVPIPSRHCFPATTLPRHKRCQDVGHHQSRTTVGWWSQH